MAQDNEGRDHSRNMQYPVAQVTAISLFLAFP
jgi:hypothetical protein